MCQCLQLVQLVKMTKKKIKQTFYQFLRELNPWETGKYFGDLVHINSELTFSVQMAPPSESVHTNTYCPPIC